MKHVKVLFLLNYEQDLVGPCICIYFQMLNLQLCKLFNVWEKWLIYWHSSPCMSKTLCRVTSELFKIYTSSMWRSTVAAAGCVLRGCSEWGGNGVWHVDSGVNPPGLLKRLLLEFNHPAILDTLWSWEGWLMSKQHTNCKHQLIQKVQSTLWMDECNPMMRKQNKLWKSNVKLFFPLSRLLFD